MVVCDDAVGWNVIEAFESGVPMTDAHGIGFEVAQAQAAIESMRAAWAELVAGGSELPTPAASPDESAVAGGPDPVTGDRPDAGGFDAWLLLDALRAQQRPDGAFSATGSGERPAVDPAPLPGGAPVWPASVVDGEAGAGGGKYDGLHAWDDAGPASGGMPGAAWSVMHRRAAGRTRNR